MTRREKCPTCNRPFDQQATQPARPNEQPNPIPPEGTGALEAIRQLPDPTPMPNNIREALK